MQDSARDSTCFYLWRDAARVASQEIPRVTPLVTPRVVPRDAPREQLSQRGPGSSANGYSHNGSRRTSSSKLIYAIYAVFARSDHTTFIL